ncbi:MAG: hypothetical protein H5T34_01645 [Candidatus Methanomethyliales bacterium]|nr:hypothetical protein [Candidatus Methanomethylicales archaeon]
MRSVQTLWFESLSPLDPPFISTALTIRQAVIVGAGAFASYAIYRGLSGVKFIDPFVALGVALVSLVVSALTAARAEELFGVRPHVQFSGAKGYHVILPLEPVRLESVDAARAALKLVQNYLSNGLCDRHVAGDAVRIFRIPNTINTKGAGNEYGGRVFIVQKWDGRRADLSRAKSIPKDFVKEARKEMKGRLEYESPTLRYYVRKLMEYGEATRWLPHRARHIIVCEMVARGRSDREIHAFFRHLDDYSEEKTQYQIDHARKLQYRYSDAAIEEEYKRLVGAWWGQ